jgi:hypothetical protein
MYLKLIAKLFVVKTQQAVEKVIVRPVGGPRVARNKAKTLRNGVFQP